MSTKNLSRTVIEGGRTNSNKGDRRGSNVDYRAQSRAFCNDIKDLNDFDDAGSTPRRRPVSKDFNDKLGPMYRWLRSQAGKSWRAVYSELITKFDTRTTAGRHVVFSHMLSDVTVKLSAVEHRLGYRDFFVDKRGILRMRESNRWTRKSWRRQHSGIGRVEIDKWTNGRYVLDLGYSLFWMEPRTVSWVECNLKWCDKWYHREVTKRTAVGDSSKLLGIEKAELHKEMHDGRYVYYRDRIVKQHAVYSTKFKQGARLSESDMKMWRKLTADQQNDLRWGAPGWRDRRE
jgi:hypothetical protein